MPKKTVKLPKKKETLADKQRKRLLRLRPFGKDFVTSSRWWVLTAEKFILFLLFLLNFWLLYCFFGQEDQSNIFSAPVIPVLTEISESLIPFSYGLRVWLLAFFVFFPLSFYLFVKEVSGRCLVAIIATLTSILPFTPFLATRVNLGIFSEDGAHMASLTLIPLVSLLLLRFLKQGWFKYGLFSSLGVALVALTSPIGLLALGIFLAMITFSEMLLGHARLKITRFLVVLLLAAGFVAFWYHPQFVFLIMRSDRGILIKKTLANLLPLSFFALPLLGIFGFLLFENRPQLQSMFIAFFLTIAFGAFSLGAGVAQANPFRFLGAFGISLAFLLGVLLVMLFDFLRLSPKLNRFKPLFTWRHSLAYGLLSLILGSLIMAIGLYRSRFTQMENRQVLGISDEQKTGVWEVKEETNRAVSILGYAITGLTILGTGTIKIKLKKLK